MPLPLIANTIRTSVEGTLPNGRAWANVMHFRKTAILTFTGAIAILDPLVFALYNAAFAGGFALKGTWKTTEALSKIIYTPLDGASVSSVFAHPLAGTEVVDALPASSSLVVTSYTAVRGRSHRGRMYLPPMCEGDNGASGGPSGVATLQNQFNGWLASFAGSGLTPVVSSYLHASAEDVVSYLVRSNWSAQRRRDARG